ncbi:hypothetical protein [Arsukibacterium sp.]|uniref:hypothetical protein n=1 Tax=Arsukibacterium sp. TaxID=1977258 RepID=UPI00299EFE9F|nr:hypothetical protein [Arsukibacterium sp.]MDX1539588.1 hypothetical protein [Arsukibacterium sp.]
MCLVNGVNQLIDKLASLYLFKGIQPSEIADTIFEKNYSSLAIEKTVDGIVLIACFSEVDEDTHAIYKHQLKYVYSADKTLQVVEQRVGNKAAKIQWSRKAELDRLIDEFVDKVKPVLNQDQIKSILSTLPREIRPQVEVKLRLVA